MRPWAGKPVAVAGPRADKVGAGVQQQRDFELTPMHVLGRGCLHPGGGAGCVPVRAGRRRQRYACRGLARLDREGEIGHPRPPPSLSPHPGLGRLPALLLGRLPRGVKFDERSLSLEQLVTRLPEFRCRYVPAAFSVNHRCAVESEMNYWFGNDETVGPQHPGGAFYVGPVISELAGKHTRPDRVKVGPALPIRVPLHQWSDAQPGSESVSVEEAAAPNASTEPTSATTGVC
jgi:hypothetical protein